MATPSPERLSDLFKSLRSPSADPVETPAVDAQQPTTAVDQPVTAVSGASSQSPSLTRNDEIRLRSVREEMSSQLTSLATTTTMMVKSLETGTKSEEKLRKTARTFIGNEKLTDNTEYHVRQMEATLDKKAVADSFVAIEQRLKAVQGSEGRLHEASKLLFSVWHLVTS